jgi:hypothetical protein
MKEARKDSSGLAAKAPRNRGGEGERAPRGVAGQVVKRTIWLYEDEARVLRIRALKCGRSESSVTREAVRRFLGID